MDTWIADVIGKMHIHKITNVMLAKSMNVSPEYISMIFNGKRSPTGIEDRIKRAVEELIDEVK